MPVTREAGGEGRITLFEMAMRDRPSRPGSLPPLRNARGRHLRPLRVRVTWVARYTLGMMA